MSKPRVMTKCIADHYSGQHERIVEYVFSDGSGGLISFLETETGPRVDLYRHNSTVQIVVGKGDEPQ